MQYRIIATLCLIMMCIGGTCSLAQQEKRAEKERYVVVPPEITLPAVASQPDCPVQFERVRIVHGIGEGKGTVAFQMRNQGPKSVRAVTFAMTTSTGGGWMDSWPRTLAAPLIMPGELVPLSGENEEEVIIPLTDALRKKLKLQGPMQAVAVFMVVSVKFADGSTYDDEATYKALQTYFEDIGSRPDR